jgi:hypothetical protein
MMAAVHEFAPALGNAASRPTTTASHSVRSIINPPFRRCKSGVKTSQSCSKSG